MLLVRHRHAAEFHRTQRRNQNFETGQISLTRMGMATQLHQEFIDALDYDEARRLRKEENQH